MLWQNFTRTEQDNKLPFDNISPCGHWYGCIPPGLSKTIDCLLTISVHVAAFQGDKPLRYTKNEPNFAFRLKNSSRWPWQEPPDIGRGTRTVLRTQSLQGFISDGWPEGAEPPETECSRQEGQVLQVMLAALWFESAELLLFMLVFR